jgi:hypothetical protein
MKKVLLIIMLFAGTLAAVELRISTGSYVADISIKNFLNHSTTHDTTVFHLCEPHVTIAKSPFFYYMDAEFHTSNTKRQKTEFANYVTEYDIPFLGSINDMTNSVIDMIPVDGDYQAVGFDVDIGVGYDIIKKGESYLGVALNTGVTLPNIDAENLTTNVSLVYDLIESWDLDISTYKLGPMLKGNLALSEQYLLYGSFSLGLQKASVESGLFKSSLDVNGNYSALDFGLRYRLSKRNFYISIGHSYKYWEVDEATVNLYNFFEADLFAPFTTELEHTHSYFTVGYVF